MTTNFEDIVPLPSWKEFGTSRMVKGLIAEKNLENEQG